MGNIVKFDTVRLPNSIKSGGFNIGVNSTTTDLTGFYNGITPINGGYTIYIDKTSNGPSIYAPQNDNDLITITKQLGGSVSTVPEALVWINSQSNMTVLNNNYPSIVTDGLVLNLDAGFVSSYPRTGTTWKDLSGSGKVGNLINGVGYDSENNGSLVFDGVDDYILLSSSVTVSIPFTLSATLNTIDISPSNGRQISGYSGNRFRLLPNRGVWLAGSDSTSETRGIVFINTPLYPIGEDFNLTVTVGLDNVVIIYVNGVNVYSSTFTYTDFLTFRTSTIGEWFTSSPVRLYGDLYSYRVYEKVLSPDEVLQNYYAEVNRFIPTDGLVLSLDAQNTNLYATSPTTAYDISGNDNNGSMLNGVQYVGEGGGSWKFDGSNDSISISNNSSLQVTGDQTLVFWVYPERRDRRQNFYAKAYGGEGTITYETNGSMNYYWGTAGSNTNPYQGVNSGAVMTTLNTWYFVVLVRELSTPTKTVKWYINGVLINQSTASYSSATASSLPITIGTGYAGSFLGKVGIVKQYNVALTQSEITTIFNATRTRYGI